DLDDPHLLRHITGLLRQDTVRWAEFFLDNGGGLHSAAGLLLDPTLHTRPRLGTPRPAQRLPGRPGAPAAWTTQSSRGRKAVSNAHAGAGRTTTAAVAAPAGIEDAYIPPTGAGLVEGPPAGAGLTPGP